MKASITVVSVDEHQVTIRDECQAEGTRSVTNDAEAVVDYLLRKYPGRRIFYYDSDSVLDELAHDGERFVGFRPTAARALLRQVPS